MRVRILFAACLLLALPRAAAAQAMPQVQAALATILHDSEGNLVEKEAIEMNFKIWQANEDALKPRIDEINRRMREESEYCKGSFEQAEYERRKAHCDGMSAQFETMKEQLKPEIANSESQYEELKRRETVRAQAMDALSQRLDAALLQLTLACAPMTPAQFAADCHLPPPAGPRTAGLVAQLNATIAGKVIDHPSGATQ